MRDTSRYWLFLLFCLKRTKKIEIPSTCICSLKLKYWHFHFVSIIFQRRVFRGRNKRWRTSTSWKERMGCQGFQLRQLWYCNDHVVCRANNWRLGRVSNLQIVDSLSLNLVYRKHEYVSKSILWYFSSDRFQRLNIIMEIQMQCYVIKGTTMGR